jgi:uncharacterized protein (TIGR02246 family)
MTTNDTDRQAVLQLTQTMRDAWNRGDAAGYASLFTDDASFVAWNGEHGHGRQAIEDAHRPLLAGPLAGSRMTLTPGAPRFVRTDVAILLATGAVALAGQPADHGSVQTFVLAKGDGRWWITAFHNTRRHDTT